MVPAGTRGLAGRRASAGTRSPTAPVPRAAAAGPRQRRLELDDAAAGAGVTRVPWKARGWGAPPLCRSEQQGCRFGFTWLVRCWSQARSQVRRGCRCGAAQRRRASCVVRRASYVGRLQGSVGGRGGTPFLLVPPQRVRQQVQLSPRGSGRWARAPPGSVTRSLCVSSLAGT